jgi:hypothetical protein
MISVWKTGSYTLAWQHVDNPESVARDWPLDKYSKVYLHGLNWSWADQLRDEALKTVAFENFRAALMYPEANISLDTFAKLVRTVFGGEDPEGAPFRTIVVTYAALWHPVWYRDSLEGYRRLMWTCSQDFKKMLKQAWSELQLAQRSVPSRVAAVWRTLERAEGRERLEATPAAVYTDPASTLWVEQMTS